MLDNYRTAPINERLRAMLTFIEKLTLQPNQVSSVDITPLRAAGLSREAIEDAIHVAVLFNIYDRVADTFEFDIPPAESFSFSARMLLKRGYS